MRDSFGPKAESIVCKICFTVNDLPLPGGPNTASDSGRGGCGCAIYRSIRSCTASNWSASSRVNIKRSPKRVTPAIFGHLLTLDVPYSQPRIFNAFRSCPSDSDALRLRDAIFNDPWTWDIKFCLGHGSPRRKYQRLVQQTNARRILFRRLPARSCRGRYRTQ